MSIDNSILSDEEDEEEAKIILFSQTDYKNLVFNSFKTCSLGV